MGKINDFLRKPVSAETHEFVLETFTNSEGVPVPLKIKRITRKVMQAAQEKSKTPSGVDNEKAGLYMLMDSLVEPNITKDFDEYKNHYGVETREELLDEMFTIGEQSEILKEVMSFSGLSKQAQMEKFEEAKN